MTKTTISIENTTRDRLAAAGIKRETYDVIINRALDALDFYGEFVENGYKFSKKEGE